MLKRFTLIAILFLCQGLLARESYYAGLIGNLDNISSADLKSNLHKIVSLYHLEHPGKVDTIHIKNNPQFKMKGHKIIGYPQAKKIIYNELATTQPEYNTAKFKPVHCDQHFTLEIPWGKSVQQALVSSGFNIEHLQARSTFHPSGDPEMAAEFAYMVADLHHLLIAEAEVNRVRRSYQFAEVTPVSKVINENHLKHLNKKAGDSKLGTDLLFQNPNQLYFEPSDSSKGLIARALFYFSIRYKLPMDPVQEFYLRKWHNKFKVSPREIRRNNIIESRQHNRNPFIDYPEFEGLIDNFSEYRN